MNIENSPWFKLDVPNFYGLKVFFFVMGQGFRDVLKAGHLVTCAG